MDDQALVHDDGDAQMDLEARDDLDLDSAQDPVLDMTDDTSHSYEEVNQDIDDRAAEPMVFDSQPSDEMSSMVDVLQCLGVEPEVAVAFASASGQGTR